MVVVPFQRSKKTVTAASPWSSPPNIPREVSPWSAGGLASEHALQQKSRRFGETARRHLIAIARIGIVIGLIVALVELASPWPLFDTVRHIASAPNCDAARMMGLAPSRPGEPGYWLKHDGDRDGIACEPWR